MVEKDEGREISLEYPFENVLISLYTKDEGLLVKGAGRGKGTDSPGSSAG